MDQPVDFIITQVGARRDRDVLLATSRLILGQHVEDTIGINIEGHLDLRHPTWRGRDPVQSELTKQHVVRCHRSLTLIDLDVHGRLVRLGCRERLTLLDRHRRIPGDEIGHPAAQRLDTQAQGRHIQQQDVRHITSQNTTLDRRADRDDLIRIHTLMRLFAVRE